MVELNRSHLRHYSVALIAVIVAFILTQLVWWLIQPHLYPLFLAAVMVSSWYGGMGAGLFATTLAAILCVYFFIPILDLSTVSRDGIVGLLQFILVALLIIFLNTRLRSTKHRSELNAFQAQRNYAHLLESEERYRLLLEGVTNYAIFMLDPKGQITSWNLGAERILGYCEAEIIGRSFALIFTPEAIKQGIPTRALKDAATKGMSKDDRWHVRKDDTSFWAHGVVTPLRDEEGNLRGFAKILQDLTERKQAEEEREELLRREQVARAEAESANHTKDDFLAVVSHELRTPMTAIVGWAGMLQTGMLDEARTAMAIETIERNANSQMQLIEDLLDVSRIVRGEISLHFSEVGLVDVIRAAIEVVQPTADVKEIDLESILVSFAESLLIRGDWDRLQQVILNLLSNAIKFTPEGGRVEVRLSVVDRRDQQTKIRHAQIQVIDTGIGISAEFSPHVFDRFRQVDSTSARSSKGLGLGLAIAHHLVKLHGGTIKVESLGIGQGTTFTVTLPLLERAEEVEEAEEVKEETNISLTGLRVLVVDDDQDAREWMSVVLEECGAEVMTVDSVDEAIAGLERQRPNVLVSDIGMPGKDGYALIRKIRELESEMGGRIPAVALTAYARVEDYQKALAEGFQLHISKPVKAIELITVVASLARRNG
ncbi:MAG: PAS domain S-box protein [Pleurocapsa minor HA4230-MV1]|jgi:PAS domain S-box-containing protein|nr:PAS domain S-box protein [Pleurocapsa minor HA4230-MV1]